MAKNFPSKRIARSKFLDFQKVANSFIEGGILANEFGYHNAAGVLVIHAVIALADALTIKFAGRKAKGKSHYDIITLLNDSIPENFINNNAINNFKKLIDHKNIVSYSGDIYYKKDIDKLMKHYERFANWANNLLDQ
jgi:hypothetical protein